MQSLFNDAATATCLYKCKDCKFAERWECGSKYFWYCGKIYSGRTNNKKLKIKANQAACRLFEKG